MDKPVTLIIGFDPALNDALVRRFLAARHDIVVVSPNDDTLGELEKVFGSKITCHHGPTHTRLGLGNALAAARETHGTVDNVICTPPVAKPVALSALDIDSFENMLKETIRSSVHVLRVFSPEMISKRPDPENAAARAKQVGTFTFILPADTPLSQPGQFSESVCQNAVCGVVRAGAIELAASGIRVNAVIALRPDPNNREPWLKERTPLGRFAHDEEIAESAAFLADENSAIITGETVTLDGGRSKLSGLIRPDSS